MHGDIRARLIDQVKCSYSQMNEMYPNLEAKPSAHHGLIFPLQLFLPPGSILQLSRFNYLNRTGRGDSGWLGEPEIISFEQREASMSHTGSSLENEVLKCAALLVFVHRKHSSTRKKQKSISWLKSRDCKWDEERRRSMLGWKRGERVCIALPACLMQCHTTNKQLEFLSCVYSQACFALTIAGPSCSAPDPFNPLFCLHFSFTL